MAFSDNLRKTRKRLHKSQTALSGETGVSVAAICKIRKRHDVAHRYHRRRTGKSAWCDGRIFSDRKGDEKR